MSLTNVAQIGADKQTLSAPIPVGLVGTAAAVAVFVEASKAPATRKAYRADWRCFTGWCDRHGLCPLPAAAETVALYIADLAETKTPATIRRRLATINQAHHHAGHDRPSRTALVESTWEGICRRLGIAPTRKSPARTDVVRQMVEALDLGRLIGVRDWALLVIGFAGALRRSELVALDVRDIAEVANGLEVLIRRSKTDQKGDGVTLALPYGSEPLTCPVRSYRGWMEASGIQTGPVYRSVTKGGALGLQRLSARAVADVVKRSAERVGLDPAPMAGHSLRAGFITSAAEAGVHERHIMDHSRHQSIPVMRRYIRDATIWQDNAAAKVGL